MERRLFGLFTGWQLTILGCVALLAPGALYATVTFSPVALVDPTTGAKSLVDSGRRLYVYDPIAGYRNLPSDLVNIQFIAVGGSNSVSCVSAYTIPAGKALVVTSVNGVLTNLNGEGPDSFYIDTVSTCPSPDLIGFDQNTTGATPFALDLGLGATAPAGAGLYIFTFNATATGFIRGYLVPANSVPAANTAEAAEVHPPLSGDRAALVKGR
jgi:hypothetical protein